MDYGVLGLAADGERVFAVGPLQEFVSSAERNGVSRVLEVADRGQSLESHIVGASAALSSVASNGAGVLCAVGDRIVTSSDAGQTWLGRSTDALDQVDLDLVSTDGGPSAPSGGGSFGRGSRSDCNSPAPGGRRSLPHLGTALAGRSS